MGLIETVGKRAKTPYHIGEIDRDVYSAEELMYSLIQSAQFLDEEILDPALPVWLQEECGLEELAYKLDRILREKDKDRNRTEMFVLTILSESEYATAEEREETRRILRTGEGMQKFEMRKARADYMMDIGHFNEAMAEYSSLLMELPEPERTLRAGIEHSRGVLYAHFYRFDMAAVCFKEAYRLREEPEYYLDYLAAVRMYLPESDYVSFVAKHPEAYDASLKLESLMEEAKESYEDDPGTRQIRHLEDLLKQDIGDSFREEMQATVRELRSNYRTNVG